MPGADDRTTYGGLSPVEALSLVGEATRADILWTLSTARESEGEPPVLPFSELRQRVAPDVASSQFNYHLQELVGHYVENRADGTVQLDTAGDGRWLDDGYALRPEGTWLTRLVRAGTFTGDGELDGIPLGVDCYHCETPLTLEYANWLCAVQCEGCDHLYDYNLTPPGVLPQGDDVAEADDVAEGDDSDAHEAVLDAVAEYNRAQRLAFARGVCPLCGNQATATFVDPVDTNYPRPDHREVFVHRGCEHCGHLDYLTVGELLLRDPALVSFCWTHGEDVTTERLWDLPFAMTDDAVTVRDRDPWRVALVLDRDDETLEIVLDETLAVLERSVQSADAPDSDEQHD